MIRMIDGVKDLRLYRIEMREAETKNTPLKNVISFDKQQTVFINTCRPII